MGGLCPDLMSPETNAPTPPTCIICVSLGFFSCFGPPAHAQTSKTKYRLDAVVYVGNLSVTTMLPNVECSLNAGENDFLRDAKIAHVRPKHQKGKENKRVEQLALVCYLASNQRPEKPVNAKVMPPGDNPTKSEWNMIKE